MSAVMKKRVLAEFQTTQTVVVEPTEEPEQPKRKRLRIQKAPKTKTGESSVQASFESHVNTLDSSRASHENFTTLSSIVAALTALNSTSSAGPSAATLSLLHQKLIALFHNDKDVALRAKCLSVLQLVCITNREIQVTIDEILRSISKETSPMVILTGLNVTLKLVNKITDPSLNYKLVTLVKKVITSTSTKVQCKCLEVLGCLTTTIDYESLPGSQSQSKTTIVADTLQFVHSYSHSHEPRVRSTAFKIMLQLHKSGAPLDVKIYSQVCQYLDDDFESVKLAAIQLLWSISQEYPEHSVSAASTGEALRLIDDAFAKICHAINDPCVQVRVLAATLLGKMPQIGQSFLEQTLDKKLMSDMRRKRSAHERQWEKVKAGEWSSGKRWADDAPKELIDADSVSLISSGAAGAFVHGLEDEFMEVRSAAVDSLCTLALKNGEFANLALDFLVDMFNDEIEKVRLKAIDSLTKISQHIVLWEDQLEVILAALEDSSMDIREGLHKLFSCCQLMTKDCVKMCLTRLLENMRKYPQDKKSIWKSLEGVGRNHPWVILPLVPEFLKIHSYFDSTETDPEDPAYVAVLILVLNAAKECPTMNKLFDEKLMKHYNYLRDTLPQLVPDLKLDQDTSSDSNGNGNEEANGNGDAENAIIDPTIDPSATGRILLKDLVEKLDSSKIVTEEIRNRFNKLVLRDLKRLSEVDEDISPVAKLTSLYIRAHLLHAYIVKSSSWIQLTQSTHNEFLKQKIVALLQLCLKMQYGFNGLNPQEYAQIMQLKLRALAMQMVYIVRGSNASALAICQNLIEHAGRVQKYLEDHGNLAPDDFTLAFFTIVDPMDDPKPGTLSKLLLPLFEQHPVSLYSFSSDVKMASATIIEPTGELDAPLKFTAGLLLGIHLDCEIYDLDDMSLVRVQVQYPDQQSHLIIPRSNDFRSVSSEETRLLTTINASHHAWTEACPITLSVVLDISGPETNFNRKLLSTSSGKKDDSTYIIKLSEEKQVLVTPRAVKRHI